MKYWVSRTSWGVWTRRSTPWAMPWRTLGNFAQGADKRVWLGIVIISFCLQYIIAKNLSLTFYSNLALLVARLLDFWLFGQAFDHFPFLKLWLILRSAALSLNCVPLMIIYISFICFVIQQILKICTQTPVLGTHCLEDRFNSGNNSLYRPAKETVS